jgi:hypothetical protein
MPTSLVGHRQIGAQPVPEEVRRAYHGSMFDLWYASFASKVLSFSDQADNIIRELERWLEPQLGEGGELYFLRGWANKLAGACARIAGIIHLASDADPNKPVGPDAAEAAVKLGREYLLPHALSAFCTMDTDGRAASARRVWLAIRQLVERNERNVLRVSRRDIHQGVRSTRSFSKVGEVDPILDFLADRYYIRPVPGSGGTGRDRRGSEWDVNPKALALTDQDDRNFSHFSQLADP